MAPRRLEKVQGSKAPNMSQGIEILSNHPSKHLAETCLYHIAVNLNRTASPKENKFACCKWWQNDLYFWSGERRLLGSRSMAIALLVFIGQIDQQPARYWKVCLFHPMYPEETWISSKIYQILFFGIMHIMTKVEFFPFINLS